MNIDKINTPCQGIYFYFKGKHWITFKKQRTKIECDLHQLKVYNVKRKYKEPHPNLFQAVGQTKLKCAAQRKEKKNEKNYILEKFLMLEKYTMYNIQFILPKRPFNGEQLIQNFKTRSSLVIRKNTPDIELLFYLNNE